YAAAPQVNGLPGGKKGWLQGYYTYEDAVQAWEHACANNLVSVVQDPSQGMHSPVTPQSTSNNLRHSPSCPPAPSCHQSPAPRHYREREIVLDNDGGYTPHRKCRDAQRQRAPASTKPAPPEPIFDDDDMYLSDEPPPSGSSMRTHLSPPPSLDPPLSAQPPVSRRPLHTSPAPSSAMRSARTEISDEDCHWIVVRGALPGVYKGRLVPPAFNFIACPDISFRAAAEAAVGAHLQPSIFRTTDLASAAMIFTRSYMKGDVSTS
ncbi:hypothetical protein C0992_005364, partial [Termitomyces sp. T32_za158]